MSAVLELCDRWDALSKGETETTKAVRAAYAADVDAGVLTSWPTCGERAVRTVPVPGVAFPHGHVTATCVEPKGHGPEHRDADGNTWIESVR